MTPTMNEIEALAIRMLNYALNGCDMPLEVRSDMILATACLHTLAQLAPDGAVVADRPAATVRMTVGDAEFLADRLGSERATREERALAGHLIRQLLRQVHSSDYWVVPAAARAADGCRRKDGK